MPKHVFCLIFPLKVMKEANRSPNKSHYSFEELVRLDRPLQVPNFIVCKEEVVYSFEAKSHDLEDLHSSFKRL
jgi:hypothetical protein